MLEVFFNPKSIAFIGATDRAKSVGLGICQNLLEGEEERKIFFVNPNKTEVLDRETFAKITDIEDEIDLAIIAVPAAVVPEVARDCARKKSKGVIIISSGFGEVGKKGEKLEKEVITILKKANVRLIGPNCLGIIRPVNNLNASFSPATPKKGGLTFLSQSGALIDSVIDKSLNQNYGFANLISFGNEADLSIKDFLEFLKNDQATKAIALYIEGLKDGRGFIKTARRIIKDKPIVILKGGRTAEGGRMVSSHSGALAGAAEIYSSAFRKAGVFETETISQLLNVSLALSSSYLLSAFQRGLLGEKIAIITNGGAIGILTADCCDKLSIEIGSYSDLLGDALSGDYRIALKKALARKEIGAVIVCQTLQTMTEVKENARTLVALQKEYFQKPILALFLGGRHSQPGLKILKDNSIACFDEPEEAVLTIKALIQKKNLLK